MSVTSAKFQHRSGGQPARTPRDRFGQHKRSAGRRGVPFLLTFEQWWSIWQQSGRWHERGCVRGKYVMARLGDRGPYAVGNVKIIPCEENSSEAMQAAMFENRKAT
jgi:hypothetical protein